jgi:hypothetical protein
MKLFRRRKEAENARMQVVKARESLQDDLNTIHRAEIHNGVFAGMFNLVRRPGENP